MKKQTLKLVLAVFVLIAVAFTASAIAHEEGEHDSYLDKKKKTHQQEEFKKKKKQEAGREKKKEVKENVAARKVQIKKDVCDDRKDKLEAKVSRLGNGAANLLEVFDKIHDRVQNFYATGQLAVADYEELNTAVSAAQSKAETAVNAVKDYSVEIDCENPDMGERLDGFRNTVKDAKEALKDYRAALVKLISAMKAEAAGGSNG